MGFPGGLDSKESACNVGDLGLIPGLGRSSGGGHGIPLQCSCLEVHGDAESATRATKHRAVAPERTTHGVFTQLEGRASGSSRDDPLLLVGGCPPDGGQAGCLLSR